MCVCVSGVEKVNTGRRGTQQLRETGIIYGNASFTCVIDEIEGVSMWTKGEEEKRAVEGYPQELSRKRSRSKRRDSAGGKLPR